VVEAPAPHEECQGEEVEATAPLWRKSRRRRRWRRPRQRRRCGKGRGTGAAGECRGAGAAGVDPCLRWGKGQRRQRLRRRGAAGPPAVQIIFDPSELCTPGMFFVTNYVLLSKAITSGMIKLFAIFGRL
jgi:hypothetical protein